MNARGHWWHSTVENPGFIWCANCGAEYPGAKDCPRGSSAKPVKGGES